MIETPQVVESTRQDSAAIHVVVPLKEIQQVFPPTVHELLAAMQQQGAAPAGPLYSYHFQMPTDVFDFDIGFPVAQPVRPAGRMIAAELPKMKVARTIYHGPMEGIGAAWGELKAWIAENGLITKTFIWESYLVGPGDTQDASAWRTQLNWPLED